MFTHQIPISTKKDNIVGVELSEFSRRFFLKKLVKKYPKSIWNITIESFFMIFLALECLDSPYRKQCRLTNFGIKTAIGFLSMIFEFLEAKHQRKLPVTGL